MDNKWYSSVFRFEITKAGKLPKLEDVKKELEKEEKSKSFRNFDRIE